VALAGDLADAEGLERLWERADAALGPVSLLVNNAAVYPRTPLERVGVEDWRQTLRVNLVAPAELARRAGLAMRERGGGAIVNLLDWAVASPQAGFLPYHASKGALAVATSALARELAPTVRVNAVAPGPILPPEGAGPGEVESVLRRTPLGRLGTPEEVAAAVEFLCRAGYVTGAVLPVDGGRTVAP
jgi:pteridine reductase